MSIHSSAASLKNNPVLFHPGVEQAAEDEAETIQGLIAALRQISETTAEDYHHGLRSVHAKSHGLVKGELCIADNLPEPLAQGLFSRAATYPVVLRFSTSPGDLLSDRVSTPRGLAIKVLNVTGELLPDRTDHLSSQDFLMVDGPAFLAPDPKSFLASLKLLALTTNKAEGFKQALSAALRGTERAIEAMGSESATVKSLGGHPMHHLLGETYFTQVPMRYGKYMAKLSLVPVSAELLVLKQQPLEEPENPDAIRQSVVNFFSQHSARWELRVQLCTNLESMPIEDASVVWSEDESPYLTVATLDIEPQLAWDNETSQALDDSLRFSPWNALEQHQPLGGVMRVRRESYQFSASFRQQVNGCPFAHNGNSTSINTAANPAD